MKTKILICLSVTFMMFSCGTSKYTVTEAEREALNNLIESRRFIIESDWAYPQTSMAMQKVMNSGLMGPGNTASNISLLGNYNFLKIEGDSVTSRLPYFGERQMMVDYGGTDSAIEFNGLLKNYQVEWHKNNKLSIGFEAKSNSENFRVSISVSPNLKTDMVLSGTGRSSIRYSGVIKPVNEGLTE